MSEHNETEWPMGPCPYCGHDPNQPTTSRPALMSNEDGTLTAVWLEDDGTLRTARSTDQGATWTLVPPGTGDTDA